MIQVCGRLGQRSRIEVSGDRYPTGEKIFRPHADGPPLFRQFPLQGEAIIRKARLVSLQQDLTAPVVTVQIERPPFCKRITTRKPGADDPARISTGYGSSSAARREPGIFQ